MLNQNPHSKVPMHSSNDPYVEDEINLREYWRVFVRRRFLILGMTFGAAIVAAIFVLLQPNIYQSKATLMPLGQSSGKLRTLLAGELSGLLPVDLRGGSESPAERILAILKSRTLAEDVIQQLGLLPLLFADMWDDRQQQWQTDNPPTVHDAVRELGDLVSINADKKTGVIAITVEHFDRELVAAIANQYIDALQGRLNKSAFSLAKKNRLFIEVQVEKTRQALTVAEEALQRFEQRHKIIALDAQAEAAVQAIASLEGEIRAKEVQLAVVQRTVTGASHEVTLLREELQGLRTQLSGLQQSASVSRHAVGSDTPADRAFPSFEDAPEIKLQYMRLQRETQIQNQLFSLLMQQLEQARIEEARDETAFQVLDAAIPPDKKSKPRRVLSVILAAIVGAFVGVLAAFSRESLEPIVHTREQVERQAGLVLLATIPPMLQKRHRRPQRAHPTEGDLVLHQSSGAPLFEAYRYFHTRLKHDDGGRGRQTVLLVSATPNDNAAPTALVNLAIASAQAGEKTLLVDSNFHQPVLHSVLRCPPAPGLADVLVDPQEWHKGIQSTTVDNLYLLPAGAVTTATSAALESPVLDALLAGFKETYDLILFAAPPVLGCTDAAVLSGKVAATCLVLTLGVSRLDDSLEARNALAAVHGNIIGAVLTDVET